MKITFSLILLLLFTASLAQDSSSNEKILYVIDSIPIIDDPDPSLGSLNNNDIANLNVITNKDKIQAIGYKDIDKVIFVTTKEFEKRSPELRKIPSVELMENKDDVWYLKKSSIPYTGKFVEYYLNGKLKGEGTFKDGKADGLRTAYYLNGNKKYFRNYVNGIAEGYSEEYFQNGKIQQKGTFKKGKDEGLWQDFYSTGEIKRQTTFVNLVPQMTKEEKEFMTCLL